LGFAFLSLLLLPLEPGFAQNRPLPVTLPQLIRSPEKFDGRLITVEGFLDIEQEKTHGIVGAFLFLNRDDAQQSPPLNSIILVPNRAMLRQKSSIDRSYVAVSGLFRAVPTEGGGYTPVLKNIQSCVTIVRQD